MVRVVCAGGCATGASATGDGDARALLANAFEVNDVNGSASAAAKDSTMGKGSFFMRRIVCNASAARVHREPKSLAVSDACGMHASSRALAFVPARRV